jgi:hypothetical protein
VTGVQTCALPISKTYQVGTITVSESATISYGDVY